MVCYNCIVMTHGYRRIGGRSGTVPASINHHFLTGRNGGKDINRNLKWCAEETKATPGRIELNIVHLELAYWLSSFCDPYSGMKPGGQKSSRDHSQLMSICIRLTNYQYPNQRW
ncbi:uncharacterized protein CIMG_13679 [Coccidioides immitis RS]|uniref:Uncharacterized protein n=1 Tax=Coccidioides immitis (strain RS) TaxID=246410 RepID=A0A0D8JWY1_COCIM|nr:uncharacterized protein CIMG_13679 [Coccidioides immitis RS]KJF61446.1 hypothetical protein CIMG_13679 [Coccidioides immitis RS]